MVDTKLKVFSADELKEIIASHLDKKTQMSIIPLNDMVALYKGNTDNKTFKQLTSSIRNSINTLYSKESNVSIKDLKASKFYHRDKVFCYLDFSKL